MEVWLKRKSVNSIFAVLHVPPVNKYSVRFIRKRQETTPPTVLLMNRTEMSGIGWMSIERKTDMCLVNLFPHY
jgi:hypothetical protein